MAARAAAIISLLVFLVAAASKTRSPHGLPVRAAALGADLWCVWLLSAVTLRRDFAWHMRLEPWTFRPGYWPSYAVSVVLGPTSPPILCASALALLAIAVVWHIGAARLALAGVALGLFVILTLRVTSVLQGMTRAGRPLRKRACGLAIAFLLAAWGELGAEPSPLHWLRSVVSAPASLALRDVLGLLGLTAILSGIDGWLTRRGLLRGMNIVRAQTLGVSLLKTGSVRSPPLAGISMLAWSRSESIIVASVLGAVSLPAYGVFAHLLIDGPAALTACLAFSLLFPSWVRGNLLGIDGSGEWRYSSAGVPPSEVLLQRGLALSLLQIIILVPTAIFAAVSWRDNWAGAAAGLAFVVSTLALQDAAGMLVSVLMPEPVVQSEYSSGVNATGGVWIAFGTMVWTALYIVAFVVAWPEPVDRYWPAAIALLCLLVRRLVVLRLRRESNDVWSERILTALGAL